MLLRNVLTRSITCATRVPRSSFITPARSFQISSFVLAKNKKNSSKGSSKKGKNEDVEQAIDPDANTLALDFDAIKSKFEAVVEEFNKHATEARLGKTNPNIFDKLKVEVDDSHLPFTSVAQTTIKGGRNFLITVYDPAHTQSVINAVLGSDLNMNPIKDPANKQMLKVPVPPPTVESRKEASKHLKVIFENLKNGKSGSLSKVRADVRKDIDKQLKKKKNLSDQENALVKEFDNLHKDFTTKLSDAFKAAEKTLSK